MENICIREHQQRMFPVSSSTLAPVKLLLTVILKKLERPVLDRYCEKLSFIARVSTKKLTIFQRSNMLQFHKAQGITAMAWRTWWKELPKIKDSTSNLSVCFENWACFCLACKHRHENSMSKVKYLKVIFFCHSITQIKFWYMCPRLHREGAQLFRGDFR